MRVIRNIGVILILSYAIVFTSFSQPQTNLVTVQLNKSSLKAFAGSKLELELIANIKDGYHINSYKPKDEFLIPVTITSGDKKFPLQKVDYPTPLEINFPSSPDPVSAYIGTIKIGITINIGRNIKPGKYNIPINFSYQTCNDESCFPPNTITNNIEVEIQENVNKNKIELNALKNEGGNKNTGAVITEKLKDTTKALSKSEAIKNESINVNEILGTIGALDTNSAADTTLTNTNSSSTEENTSLLIALIFAFAGGIILNLMPCVLPVLSIKIMGFIQQAGEEKSKTRKHGLAFTLGVLVSFWILAGLLIALRAGGEYLGWGFQLQSPGFIIVLSILLFLFGLSMFGVFEIGTSFSSAGQNLKSTGYFGSFISGVLATIVATPCTAPFMGSALGFALSQPVFVSLFVFTFLGLGMALPYVLLTSIPKLLKFVPKPGAWMESLKQFMGFLLMATVLWLAWVLSFQAGSEGVLFLLASLIIAAIGGWIFGRWGNVTKSTKVRRVAQVVSVLVILFSLLFSFKNIQAKTKSTAIVKQGSIEWLPYSPKKISDAVKDGKPVFVDFTAAWCLSCQANEKVAFGSKEVQEAFSQNNIVALRADWTNSDPVITKALAEFGRNSVPLYVLYKSGDKPVILPEILTPEIVLDAIRNN